MTEAAAMFLFLAATVVGVFAFLSIAVWVGSPAHERQVRDRLALLRAVAESPGENAARVLEMLQAEDEARARRKAESHRQGLILGGLVITAVGVGMGAAFGLIGGGNTWALGLIVAPLGLVLAGTGYRMKIGGSR